VWRARNAVSRSAIDPAAGIDAVLNCAFALEALVNDLTHFSDRFIDSNSSDSLKALKQILPLLEEERASTRLKYEAIIFILSGKPFDHGGSLFSDFSFLFTIRNELAHPKLYVTEYADSEYKHTKKIERLIGHFRSRNLIEDIRKNSISDWTLLVQSAITANWAYTFLIAFFTFLKDITPASKFREWSFEHCFSSGGCIGYDTTQ